MYNEKSKEELISLLEEKTVRIETLNKIVEEKKKLIDLNQTKFYEEKNKVIKLEDDINQINLNNIASRLAQIKLSKILLNYNGNNDCTHREKMYHTERAIKVLDIEYEELMKLHKEKLNSYSNINQLPF